MQPRRAGASALAGAATVRENSATVKAADLGAAVTASRTGYRAVEKKSTRYNLLPATVNILQLIVITEKGAEYSPLHGKKLGKTSTQLA